MNPCQSLRDYELFVYRLQQHFPGHKHVPPDIKHHRTPAPELSLTVPNLPGLIREIETASA